MAFTILALKKKKCWEYDICSETQCTRLHTGIRKLYGYPNNVSSARFLRQSVPGFNLYVGFPLLSQSKTKSFCGRGISESKRPWIIVVTWQWLFIGFVEVWKTNKKFRESCVSYKLISSWFHLLAYQLKFYLVEKWQCIANEQEERRVKGNGRRRKKIRMQN